MKQREFMMYPVHSSLLNFRVEFRRNITYNDHSMVRFLNIELGEDCGTVEGVELQ